jgi:RES domain-containing protein
LHSLRWVGSPSGKGFLVYRVVLAAQAARAYTGAEALEKGGRWTEPGFAVVYTASSCALAALEALVHLDDHAQQRRFVVVPARVPGSLRLASCRCPPPRWDMRPHGPASQRIGARWLRAGRSAVLEVPSVVVRHERNYLLATDHPDFARIRVLPALPFRFDPRLRT